jgi:hypothetical protein
MPLVDYRPNQASDFGPATLSNGPRSTHWLTVGSDGHLYENGARFQVVSDHYIETNCGFKLDADVANVTAHSAAYGVNFVRFLGWNNKAVATSGLYNLGCWTDPSGTGANNGAVVYGATYNEAFLVQMDKTIEALNARNIRIWLNFDHGDKARIVAGLAPCSANGSTSTKAANGDHGMMWSETWNAMYRGHIYTILNRVNTQTGVAYKDNPLISVVSPFNENTFWDAATKALSDPLDVTYTGIDFIVSEVGGTGGGHSGGSGWWRAELDAHWNAYATANGFAWPVSRFPLFATWNAWGNTDKERMIEYIDATDLDAANAYRTFIKGMMPNVIYYYVETRYADIRIAASSANDLTSLHHYASEGSGLASSVARKSCIDNTSSGINYTYYSQRVQGKAHVTTEEGQYSRNRNDGDMHWFKASIDSLQDTDGSMFFCMWQNQYYSAAAGWTGGHYMAMYPSRRLAALFSAPIRKHRLIGPMPGSQIFTVDPSLIAGKTRSSGEVCIMGERAARINGSSTNTYWSWTRGKLYTTLGTPESLSPDLSVATADVQAGITLTASNGTFTMRGAGYASPKITWDFPGVIGEAITVDNFTRGQLTIAGLAAPYKGIAAIRSSGPWNIGGGASVLFLHGPTFQSDCSVDGNSTATNIDDFLAADGVTVTGGTEAATRLWTPAAVTVTLTDIGRKQRVYGLTASALSDVTGTLIASTWDQATGTLTFTSDSAYPAYHIEPEPVPVGSFRDPRLYRGGVQ